MVVVPMLLMASASMQKGEDICEDTDKDGEVNERHLRRCRCGLSTRSAPARGRRRSGFVNGLIVIELRGARGGGGGGTQSGFEVDTLERPHCGAPCSGSC